MTNWLRSLRVAVVALVLASGLAGCGTPAVCDDLAAVKSTTHDLKARHLAPGTVSDVRNDLNKLNSQLHKLAADASSQYSSQINSLRSSLTALGSAISAAVADPSAATLGQLPGAVDAVGTAVDTLSHALSNTC